MERWQLWITVKAVQSPQKKERKKKRTTAGIMTLSHAVPNLASSIVRGWDELSKEVANELKLKKLPPRISHSRLFATVANLDRVLSKASVQLQTYLLWYLALRVEVIKVCIKFSFRFPNSRSSKFQNAISTSDELSIAFCQCLSTNGN